MKGEIKIEKENMQKISFWITKQTYEKLKRKAKMMDIPVSSVYRHYLERGVGAEEKGEKVSPKELLEMERRMHQRMETFNRLRSALDIAGMPTGIALKTLRVLRNGKLGFRIPKEQFEEFMELVNFFRLQIGERKIIIKEKAKRIE